MTWLPTAKTEVDNVTLPVLSSAPLKIMVPLSRTSTVPVGVAALLTPDTAMPNVIDCPNELGFGVTEMLTAALALFTTWMMLVEEPPTKLAFPPKTACTMRFPALGNEVVRLPVPEESTGAVPSVRIPSAKINEPEMLPLPGKLGWTVAVRVTGCNAAEGF